MQILSNKKWNALEQTLKSLQTQSLNQFMNFNNQIFPVYKEYEDAYENMDMIYSIIKKLATNAAMVPFYAYDKVKDTDLPDTDKLNKFLETLDFEQKEIMYTYLWSKGEVFALKQTLDLGVNAGNVSMTLLNPSFVTVIVSESFPPEIVGYVYYDIANGEPIPIDLENMFFVKFPNPTKDRIKRWRGLAPTDALRNVLTRIESEDDVSVAQLQNGGIPGVLFDKTPGLAADVLGKRKDSLGRFLSNKANKGAPYLAAGEMGYIPLGSNLVDLTVAELSAIDKGRACNAFGVSTILFNDNSASTESNVQGMKKEMYTNTIIPNVHRVESALNKFIVPDIKTTGIVKCDVSEIKELHDDEAKKAAALASKYWLTGNEKREADGYDQDVADPLMDKYIIPSGMVLLDDLNMVVPPVDNAAGDYQAPVVPLKQANG